MSILPILPQSQHSEHPKGCHSTVSPASVRFVHRQCIFAFILQNLNLAKMRKIRCQIFVLMHDRESFGSKHHSDYQTLENSNLTFILRDITLQKHRSYNSCKTNPCRYAINVTNLYAFYSKLDSASLTKIQNML